MKKLTTITVLTLFTFTIFLFGCGKKDDNMQTKKDDKTTTQPQTQQQTQPKTQTNVSAPKIGTIWAQVEKKNEALGKAIQATTGHLDDPIDEVINLLKTLPAKSNGLEQTKIDVVNSKITEMEKTGKNLDDLHHEKKTADLNKEYDKFNQLLKDIKSQYPAESFN